MTSHRRRATVELETKMKRITSHFLVNFFCKLASQYPDRNLLYLQVYSPLLWNISKISMAPLFSGTKV